MRDRGLRSYGRAYLRIHSPAGVENKLRAAHTLDSIWKQAKKFADKREIDEMLDRIASDPSFYTLRDGFAGKNKILYTGLALITGQLAETASISIPNRIQLGSSTQALSPSDPGCISVIGVSGLTEATATTTQRATVNQTNDTLELLHTFTAGGSANINELAIRNSDGTPINYARLLVSPTKSVVSPETVAVTYRHTFTTA